MVVGSFGARVVGYPLTIVPKRCDNTSNTLQTVQGIGKLMLETKHQIRTKLPKIYSQDLVNNLFQHPYTKIGFVMTDLGVSRKTARRYLQALVEENFVSKHQSGKSKFFVNERLFQLL
jgi:Fic family protein